MTPDERQAVIGRLRVFFNRGDDARKLRTEAAEIVDQDSMARADDLMALYEDRAWLADMPPLKATSYRGQPVEPDSFNRFSRWLVEQKIGSGARAYQLHNAHVSRSKITHQVSNLPAPATERAIRPLWREFFKWGGESDRIGAEVYAKAVELAGGQAPTQREVRQALKDWQSERRTSMPIKTRGAASTYISAHDKALAEVKFLLQVGEIAMAIDTVLEAAKLLEAAGVNLDEAEQAHGAAA